MATGGGELAVIDGILEARGSSLGPGTPNESLVHQPGDQSILFWPRTKVMFKC